MGHLKIWSMSYVQKKGRESNLQFDSWPLKVRNRLDPVCAGGVKHTVGKLSSLLQTSSQSEVWAKNYDLVKSRESKPGQFRDSTLGVLGQKVIRMWVRWSNAKNTIWEKVMASPESEPWLIKWVRVAHGLSQHQEWSWRCTNQLVGWFLM
jgi:hypothetical protein